MNPRAPKHLSREARAWWKALTEEYAIDDCAGVQLVGVACECLDRLRRAQALIEEHGELVATESGSLKANPAVGIEKDARAHLMQALKQLNLDIEPLRDRGRPPLPAGWKGTENAH